MRVRLLPADKADGVVELSDDEDTQASLPLHPLRFRTQKRSAQLVDHEGNAPQTVPLSAVLTSVVAPARLCYERLRALAVLGRYYNVA